VDLRGVAQVHVRGTDSVICNQYELGGALCGPIFQIEWYHRLSLLGKMIPWVVPGEMNNLIRWIKSDLFNPVVDHN
jgi:hypothetical protein